MRARLTAKATAVLFIACIVTALADDLAGGRFAFTSISVEGTNLIVRASVPPGLKNAALEMRPDLNSSWQLVKASTRTAADGRLEFVLPRPAVNGFLRIIAQAGVDVAATEASGASEALKLLTIPSLRLIKNSAGQPVEATFHFRGRVDGSDKILIKRDGLFWEHVNWAWPDGVVTVNDTSWSPAAQNYATPGGGQPLLPTGLAFNSAKLEVISGRDVVALEQTGDGLIVYINDTPNGPDDYEFVVHFYPVQPKLAARSTPATLKVVADIDGSDCLHITKSGARWEHFHWALPRNVTINGTDWNVAENEFWKGEPDKSLLPEGVDLSSARVMSKSGRDLATLWATPDEVKIYFADNPNGFDRYELTVAFGP